MLLENQVDKNPKILGMDFAPLCIKDKKISTVWTFCTTGKSFVTKKIDSEMSTWVIVPMVSFVNFGTGKYSTSDDAKMRKW